MSLTNGTADALADAIVAALSITEPTGIAQWKTICELFYSHIKSDAVVNLGQLVATTGGPTAQTGSVTTNGSLS